MNYLERIDALLGRITYKPNVRLSCMSAYNADSSFITIHLVADVPNAEDPRYLIPITSIFTVDRYLLQQNDEQELISYIRFNVQRFEMYELDEFFKIDGKRLNNPHPDLNKA